MKTCPIEGCGGVVYAREWCCKHYNRWLRYGDASYERPARQQCSVAGCERLQHSKGMCNMHAERVRRTGKVDLPPRPSLVERLEACIRYETNGCWTWTGTRTTSGYGLLSVNAKLLLVHRLAYQTLVREIPPGMHLDHLCRNRACINPKHLDVVTNRENVMRGMSPSAVIRRQGICKNGHEMVGENIYVPPKRPQHRTCRECRKRRSREAYARKVA